MKRKKVKSSNIHSIGYSKSNRVLEVRFNSGGVYQYGDVPLSVAKNFLSADSKGKFFHKFICGVFLFERIFEEGE